MLRNTISEEKWNFKKGDMRMLVSSMPMPLNACQRMRRKQNKSNISAVEQHVTLNWYVICNLFCKKKTNNMKYWYVV